MKEADADAVVESYSAFQLEILHHAITVADQKAAFILALALAFAVTALPPTIHLLHGHAYLSGSLGLLGELGMLVGGVAAFLTVAPRIVARSVASDTYWASPIFKGPAEAYAAHMLQVSPSELSAKTLRHLHLIAGICRRKYLQLQIAFYAAPIGVAFLGLAYLTKPG